MIMKTPASKMPKSRYVIAGITACAMLITGIDNAMVSVAFPVITDYFKTSIILAGWVFTISQLVLVISSPIAGKISDVLGRKFTFMLWISVFTVGSLLSSLAPSIEWLIFFRFLQAFGSGGVVPVAIAIIAEQFPNSRHRAIGLFTSIFPIGMIIGPNLGGWMLGFFSWRALFWVNIPLGILILIGGSYLLRSDKKRKGRIDFAGAGILSLCLASFMVALSLISRAGDIWSLILVIALFVITAASGMWFVRHERRDKDPIIDIELMKRRPFMASNIFNFVYGAVIGLMSLIPTYAVTVLGMSSLQSGIILTPRSAAMILTTVVASNFILKWGYRRPLLGGSVIFIITLALLSFGARGVSFLGIGLGGMSFLIVMMMLIGAGSGLNAPAANNAAIELMPEKVATITGIIGMCRIGGTAVGITVSTLVLDKISDRGLGFSIIFLGMALVVLLVIPAIFALPKIAKAKNETIPAEAKTQVENEF